MVLQRPSTLWAGDDEHGAAAAADAGQEVLADLLKPMRARTLQCSGAEFKRFRELARKGNRRSIFCLPVANPLSTLSTIWSATTTLTDMTYTAFIVALSLGFSPRGRPISWNWIIVCDILGSAVYVVDLVAGFHMGVVCRWENRAVVVRDGRTVATFYLRNGLLLDVLAVIPCIIQLIVWLADLGGGAWRILFLLRLFRLGRVIRLIKQTRPGQPSGPIKVFFSMVSTRTLLLWNALFAMAVLINLLGCFWWTMADIQGIQNSWASSDYINKAYELETASGPARWLVSCYFASTTMLTIGYGDIGPVTIAETGVVLVFEIVGVAFFGYLLSTITEVLSASGSAARRMAAVKQKMEDVEEVLLREGASLPKKLQARIRVFYSEYWHTDEVNRMEIFGELPPRMQLQVTASRMGLVLGSLDFYPPGYTSKQRRHAQSLIADASTVLKLDPGQELQEASAAAAAADAAAAAAAVFVAGPNAADVTLGPCWYLMDEGEMRVLQPGDSMSRQALNGGRVDFSGPAIIGLSALFSDLVHEGNGGGSDKLSGSGSGSGGESPAAGGGAALVAPVWEQRALALTTCYLWRIDCASLYGSLRAEHPRLLLHLLTRTLGVMGELIDAAESGAPPLEQQASRQLSAGPSESHMGHGHSARRRFVNKLRRQRTELESAAAAALAAEAVAASGKSKSGGVGRSGPSLGASSMGTLDADVAGEFWQAGAPADVEAGQGQGPTVPADVWHADG